MFKLSRFPCCSFPQTCLFPFPFTQPLRWLNEKRERKNASVLGSLAARSARQHPLHDCCFRNFLCFLSFLEIPLVALTGISSLRLVALPIVANVRRLLVVLLFVYRRPIGTNEWRGRTMGGRLWTSEFWGSSGGMTRGSGGGLLLLALLHLSKDPSRRSEASSDRGLSWTGHLKLNSSSSTTRSTPSSFGTAAFAFPTGGVAGAAAPFRLRLSPHGGCASAGSGCARDGRVRRCEPKARELQENHALKF